MLSWWNYNVNKNGFEITDAINRISTTRRIPIIAMAQTLMISLIGFDLRVQKVVLRNHFFPL